MKRNDDQNGIKVDGQEIAHGETDQRTLSGVSTGVLRVVVPYTTPELTRTALRHAAVCSDLDVYIALVDIQVVPFPCPLDVPPINTEHSKRRLVELLTESKLPGKTVVLYTRDRLEAFSRVLESGSLVMIASKKRWWPTREDKLALALTKAGHQVMLLPVVR